MNQELLYKYFKGITSVEEEKMILDWIDASDENRDIFLKERMIYDISLFSDKQGNNENEKRCTHADAPLGGPYSRRHHCRHCRLFHHLRLFHITRRCSCKQSLCLPDNGPKLSSSMEHAYG